jgi:hypothetical protein
VWSGNQTCSSRPSGNGTTEVWLDHLDELSSIPHRGFHSAFEESDAGGALGMHPWTSIHDGIGRSSAQPFDLLFVFGGMQMITVQEAANGALAMHSDDCFQSNMRVLNSFRQTWLPPASFDPHALRRVLVISRSGTWWRRWLNEKVSLEIPV